MGDRFIIASSRFAPLSDVQKHVNAHPDDLYLAWGTSAVTTEIQRIASRCTTITATPSRQELIDAGRRPSCTMIAFVAKDPETLDISEGTAANIALLQAEGIAVEIVTSSLNAKQASLYYDLETEYRKFTGTPNQRSRFRRNRLTETFDAFLTELNAYDRAVVAEDARMTGLYPIDPITKESTIPTDEEDKFLRSYRRLITLHKLADQVERAIHSETRETVAA